MGGRGWWRLAFAGCWLSGAVTAAELVVVTADDGGPGSLREAVAIANGNAEADRISFAAALDGQTVRLASSVRLEPDTAVDGDRNGDCRPDIQIVADFSDQQTPLLEVVGPAQLRGLALHSAPGSALQLAGEAVELSCLHIGSDPAGEAALPVGREFGEAILVSGQRHRIGPDNLIAHSRGAGVRVIDQAQAGYPDFSGLNSDAPPRVYSSVAFGDDCASFGHSDFQPVDGDGRPFTDYVGLRLRGRLTVSASGEYAFTFGSVDDAAQLRLDGQLIGELSGNGEGILRAALEAGAHAIEIAFIENQGGSRLSLQISGPGSASLSSDDQALCPSGQPGLCGELFQLRRGSERNQISRNRMHDNRGPGIAHSYCAPNVDDSGDADVGPNTRLNAPRITALAALGGGDFSVTGTAPADSTVELFIADEHASGRGEGAQYLASGVASAAGNFAVVAALPGQAVLTATATDVADNTSEFGANFGYSTGARGLYARGLSASSIDLSWQPAGLGETGWRVERSDDGIAFQAVGQLPATASNFIDSGLAANRLFYYRVVGEASGGDRPASNRATASTFPELAAKVCFDRVPRATAFAFPAGAAWDGEAWAVVWFERAATRDNVDLLFQRFSAETLQPIGSPTLISAADSNAQGIGPRLQWNGVRHAVTWFENLRGETAENIIQGGSPLFFAELDGSGQLLRGPVPVRLPTPTFEIGPARWDGSGWSLVGISSRSDLSQTRLNDLFLLQLDASGTPRGEPITLVAAVDQDLQVVDMAVDQVRGHYGVGYFRGRDSAWEVVFQRFASNGEAIDAEPVVLEAFESASGGVAPTSLRVLLDGAQWVLAWSRDDPSGAVETATYLRRVDGSSGLPLAAGPSRLSDDPQSEVDIGERVNDLRRRPDGGYAVFVEKVASSGRFELARLDAAGDGSRQGGTVYLTPDDGQGIGRSMLAHNDQRSLAVFGAASNASLPNEVHARLIDAAGLEAPAEVVTLTRGHDAAGVDLPRWLQLAAVGEGFVAVWTEGLASAPRLNLRAWNGQGQAVSTLTPLTATSNRGSVAVATLGPTVALAWKTLNNEIIFARYNASGGSLVGERVIAQTGNNPNTSLGLGWDGETFALWWNQNGGRFQRIGADGEPIGSAVAVPRGPDGLAQMAWLGDSWALVTRQGTANGNLEYLRLSPAGALLDGPRQLTAVDRVRQPGGQRLHFSGRDLGLLWHEWRGLDPPGEDVFFSVLERDGSFRFEPQPVLATGQRDLNAQLYSVGDRFRVVGNGFGSELALHEVELDDEGRPLTPRRPLAPRSSGIGPVALAHNGATTGWFYFPGGLQHLHLHTDACLADSTPPSCPPLRARSHSAAVELDWTAASDPESGILRYLLYRDGLRIGEFDADLSQGRDQGFNVEGHDYQLRALNGSFMESVACPLLPVEPRRVFADGFEQPP